MSPYLRARGRAPLYRRNVPSPASVKATPPSGSMATAMTGKEARHRPQSLALAYNVKKGRGRAMDRFARIVLGYHGCASNFAEAILRGDLSIKALSSCSSSWARNWMRRILSSRDKDRTSGDISVRDMEMTSRLQRSTVFKPLGRKVPIGFCRALLPSGDHGAVTVIALFLAIQEGAVRLQTVTANVKTGQAVRTEVHRGEFAASAEVDEAFKETPTHPAEDASPPLLAPHSDAKCPCRLG
jgi:hypothetical protein